MAFQRSLARKHVVLILGIFLILSASFSGLSIASADETPTPAPDSADLTPQVDPQIQRIWQMADGAVADGSPQRAWVWGPTPLAIAVEHDADSSTGNRQMVYYDKGRLEINDPGKDPADPWYVSGAALVREMLTGKIQFGTTVAIERGRATIPIIGDPSQPHALTYATLAPLATLEKPAASSTGMGITEQDTANARVPAIGKAITALVDAHGRVTLQAVPDSSVQVGAFDETTGHTIAAPFNDWSNAEPYPALYLLGHPLTEPYWLDTTINGQAERVLFQAFERRILIFHPNAPVGQQVESSNVGLHYRLWRNLSQPSNPGLIPLASTVPFGEEIVAAATSNLIDPYLLAAIALAASNGDPEAKLPNGGQGILGLRPEAAEQLGVPTVAPPTTSDPAADLSTTTRLQGTDESITVADVMRDPELNAAFAAREVARWNPQSLDFGSIAADYYSGGNPNPDDANQAAFVDTVLQIRAALLERYPMPSLTPPPGTEPGQLLGTGHAAYYSPSYDRAWWERTLLLYEGWGSIAAGWKNDPNGYYCVRPGYIPGQRLRLMANGVTITCTIGDTVAEPHLSSWLAHWVIELNWDAFQKLGLDRTNTVTVFHIGAEDGETAGTPIPTPEPSPSSTPTPVPTETPSPTPTPTPLSETPPPPTATAGTPTDAPAASPTPTDAPTTSPTP